MIEGTMAWAFLILGTITQNADLFIASGVFAVALQIHRLREEGINNEGKAD